VPYDSPKTEAKDLRLYEAIPSLANEEDVVEV